MGATIGGGGITGGGATEVEGLIRGTAAEDTGLLFVNAMEDSLSCGKACFSLVVNSRGGSMPLIQINVSETRGALGTPVGW